jgi:hypothetical protein
LANDWPIWIAKMSADVCPADRQHMKPRAAVSNGTRAVFGDGRSVGARRYRDLLQAFGEEYGGYDRLSPSGQQIVRRLAQVSVELELLESERAAGRAIDPVTFCTLVNAQRRLLRDAAKAAVRPVAAPSLQDHLARNYGAPSEAA